MSQLFEKGKTRAFLKSRMHVDEDVQPNRESLMSLFQQEEYNSSSDIARKVLDMEGKLGQGAIGPDLVKEHELGLGLKSHQPRALVQSQLEELLT